MTPEQRLDRLERIAKLFVRAGARARGTIRSLEGKVNIILDAQLANEERFARLAEAQAHSERRMDALIDIVRDRFYGKNKGEG